MRSSRHESREARVLIALLAHIVRLDFLASPELTVEPGLACQRWSMDAETCTAVLGKLCDEGFLEQTGDGMFTRRR